MTTNHTAEFQDYLESNRTLAYMMLRRAEEFDGNIALRYMRQGRWESLSWRDFGSMIRSTGKALLKNGIAPGDMVSIYSQNSPEWAVADLGILAVRGVTVPIYATNSAAEAGYIIDDARVKIVFVGDQGQYDNVRSLLPSSPGLAMIIAFDPAIRIDGPESIHFRDFIAQGSDPDLDLELENRLTHVHSDDMLTLIYTSGTTGKPKGAVHTHRSFMAGIYPSVIRFPWAGKDHVSLAVLPLSHVFERMWSYGCMSTGVQIAYCPDPKMFVEVMRSVRPHAMTSVPRIWEKVFGTINEMTKTAPPMKRRLFQWARSVALKHYRARMQGRTAGIGLRLRYAAAEALVIKKVRAGLGCERNRVFHVGGAPFAPEINEFFQSFGINVIMGYGLTEFFPVCVGFDDKGIPGACGPVIPMVEVRISDEGEIQLRGTNAMREYYGMPEETVKVFTVDGWFRTGDIGRIEHQNGYDYIVITDRIKDIIITAGGKNISPQQIELLLGDELLVEQFVVIGDGRKYITALVVPNFPLLEEWARKEGIPFGSRGELVAHEGVKGLYRKIIDRNTADLGQVEKIKDFTLLEQELTQDAGELTPTLKIKRKFIDTKYRETIDRMYR
ncbi:MAG: long-chain fatty acid--CoA ligase [Spirochaetes bacterium]|nr:long-chain fatty acid--CoA ligase [Spirochaetota bacterium]